MTANVALVLRIEKDRKMLADELFTRVTGQTFSSAIDRRVAAAHVVHVKRVFGILKQLAVTLFTFAQRLLRLFTLCDISCGAFVEQDLAGVITHGACVHTKPDSAAVFAKRLVLEITNDAMLLEQSFELLTTRRIDINLA